MSLTCPVFYFVNIPKFLSEIKKYLINCNYIEYNFEFFIKV